MVDGDQQEEKLENVLGSKGKIRVLVILAREPHVWHSLYSLEQKTGIRRTYLRKDVAALVENMVVTVSEFPPLKYRFNLEDVFSRRIYEFLTGVLAQGTPSL
jgi:hypothetical protein